MPYELRLPNITSSDPSVQLAQTQSYLRQMAEYLNWALNTISGETAENTNELVYMNGNKIDKDDKEAKETFEKLKDLIIKSADIVYAYEHAMQIKLEDGSTSIADFGTYVNQMNSEIKANGYGIEQTYNRTQSIQHKDGTTEIVDSNAYIKTGLLDTVETVDIYGVEIGKDNKKSARFTGDRLSFYQDGLEVAYVSNNKLYINNAELNGNLRVGGYYIKSDRGLAFLWVGEETNANT